MSRIGRLRIQHCYFLLLLPQLQAGVFLGSRCVAYAIPMSFYNSLFLLRYGDAGAITAVVVADQQMMIAEAKL
jgi:hypothetical protein